MHIYCHWHYWYLRGGWLVSGNIHRHSTLLRLIPDKYHGHVVSVCVRSYCSQYMSARGLHQWYLRGVCGRCVIVTRRRSCSSATWCILWSCYVFVVRSSWGQCRDSPTLILLCSWGSGCRLAGAGGGDCTHASLGLPALLPSLQQHTTSLMYIGLISSTLVHRSFNIEVGL